MHSFRSDVAAHLWLQSVRTNRRVAQGAAKRRDKLAGDKQAFLDRVDPRGISRDGYRVNLQLFQDRQLLLETDATLSQSGPLVIAGPQIGAGQLLLLLVVQ